MDIKFDEQRHKKHLEKCKKHGIDKVELVIFVDGCIHPELNETVYDIDNDFVKNFTPCKGCKEIVCEFIAHVDFDE